VVLSRPQNPGEITAAGATVVEIGELDSVKLTVYIPEDQYGAIKLAQEVKVSVDSFTGRSFTGKVTYISNQAEFTPRNVQTVESRSTTVYAIEITIDNPNHDLKDGMPADATF
jgi:HlyD family secretion protein